MNFMTGKNNKKIIKTLVILSAITISAAMLSGCTESTLEGLTIVVVSRDSASGTREFFWSNVMDKEDFALTTLEKNSNGAVHQTVSQTPGAVGFVGLGYVDNNVKALKIDGVEATVENVVSGDYPIARNLNMFTDGEPTGLALEFLNYMDSAEGQAIVEEEGFVPKEDTGSYQIVEGLSGTLTITGSTTVLPIADLVAEQFEELYENVQVTVTGGGSSVGVQSAGAGTVDIGMASREMKSSEQDNYPNLVEHVICSDGIAVIVHPTNTYVDDLTVEQVKSVYTGETTNWDEFN
jgi:phosphate transport system substrate-binding protein